MSVESVLEAARGGLTYERLRLDAASRNIASANAPVAQAADATLWQVQSAGGGGANDFATMAGARLSQEQAQVRQVYDPGHPMAGADGMVAYPAVDMVQEMTTLMTASRGYEANVRSFNFLRNMLLRAIEIGAK